MPYIIVLCSSLHFAVQQVLVARSCYYPAPRTLVHTATLWSLVEGRVAPVMEGGAAVEVATGLDLLRLSGLPSSDSA